ncbi:hypothetical protein THAOC_28982, partial [Thalassiosira oceanica]
MSSLPPVPGQFTQVGWSLIEFVGGRRGGGFVGGRSPQDCYDCYRILQIAMSGGPKEERSREGEGEGEQGRQASQAGLTHHYPFALFRGLSGPSQSSSEASADSEGDAADERTRETRRGRRVVRQLQGPDSDRDPQPGGGRKSRCGDGARTPSPVTAPSTAEKKAGRLARRDERATTGRTPDFPSRAGEGGGGGGALLKHDDVAANDARVTDPRSIMSSDNRLDQKGREENSILASHLLVEMGPMGRVPRGTGDARPYAAVSCFPLMTEFGLNLFNQILLHTTDICARLTEETVTARRDETTQRLLHASIMAVDSLENQSMLLEDHALILAERRKEMEEVFQRQVDMIAKQTTAAQAQQAKRDRAAEAREDAT